MRGKKAKRRQLRPDIKYNSLVVAKLINYVMLDGEKTVATKQVYDAMEEAAAELKGKPLEVFDRAIENIKPKLEVRSRRVGGANYQVPTPVREDRQLTLALRWLVRYSREARKNTPYSTALARELVASYNKESASYKKKEDVHKMAEANRAFAHFQW